MSSLDVDDSLAFGFLDSALAKEPPQKQSKRNKSHSGASQVSCHVCESSYPTHPLECMNCGVHCFERHCEDPDSHECLANRAANDCLNACMHEALAEVRGSGSNRFVDTMQCHYDHF